MPKDTELEIVFELTKWKIFLIWFWTLFKNEKRVDKIIESCVVIK
jgi:hypothetical protein